ncbi:hypothetical protein SB2_12020 [Methylobacterium radiotolerans]|nr:hypothetical protein SB3_06875 [Methylobacterium radiotolerans]KTS47913.1 hypothetical protein SB2_12020 [Methylobacterium radiotolerans]
MSLAILMALVAGALCLGMLSVLVPLSPKPDLDTGEADAATFGFEEEFFNVGGAVINLEPTRG